MRYSRMVKILKISGKTSDSEIHNRVDLVQIKLHNLSIVSIIVRIEKLHRECDRVYVCLYVYYFVFIRSNFAFAVLISSWSRPQDLKSSDTWKNHAHSPSLHQTCVRPSVRPSVRLSINNSISKCCASPRFWILWMHLELICVALWTNNIYGMSPCNLSP